MKKLLLFTLLISFVVACTKEEGEEGEEPIINEIYIDDFWTSIKKEYNITNEDLIYEGGAIGIDTSQIFFNGRVNQKLWIGGYNKHTKEQLIEWTEDTKLDTIFEVYKGYGEYKTLKTNEFRIYYPLVKENNLVFVLYGLDNNSRDYDIISYLYFINDNKLIKKHFNNTLDRYQNIIPWYNSIIVEVLTDKYERYNLCYSYNGDTLFTVHKSAYNINNLNPINVEEYIDDSELYDITNLSDSFFFKRSNLKTGENIWISYVYRFENINESIRVDSTSITKNDEIWNYKFYLTTYNNDKITKELDLNIETGEVVIKE